MNSTVGYSNTFPLIKSAHFPHDKIVLELWDGRILNIPLDRFPEIEKLTPSQRKKHKTLAGMGLMFDDCDTVFHVSDFIGKPLTVDASPQQIKKAKSYTSKVTRSSHLAEPKTKYKKVISEGASIPRSNKEFSKNPRQH